MEPTQTALIVPIPEAEEAVGRFRASLDRAASWGVPAHVTVLYPFLPPQQITEQTVAALRDTIAGVPRFDVALTHVDWFGDAVLWLAPQPDRQFRDLTSAVWQRFPEAPPYAGAHSDVVPHLTIGHDADKPVLTHAAETVAAYLPIHAAVDRVRLIAGTPDVSPWHTVCEFPLGAPGTGLQAVSA
ncbi:2'-5' RNA ligase family protein [Micromonospora parva]|uniref:2'-5' RNA ligase family protein n=1 Tax=Micromonospora parva TaxID=1464048 RepID=UPI0033D642D1